MIWRVCKNYGCNRKMQEFRPATHNQTRLYMASMKNHLTIRAKIRRCLLLLHPQERKTG